MHRGQGQDLLHHQVGRTPTFALTKVHHGPFKSRDSHFDLVDLPLDVRYRNGHARLLCSQGKTVQDSLPNVLHTATCLSD
jgi:hypothetical protein